MRKKGLFEWKRKLKLSGMNFKLKHNIYMMFDDVYWYNYIVTIVKNHQHSSMGCEMNTPHNAFSRIEKDDNLAKAIWTSKVA
jgi:hypothetical protein